MTLINLITKGCEKENALSILAFFPYCKLFILRVLISYCYRLSKIAVSQRAKKSIFNEKHSISSLYWGKTAVKWT